MAKLSVWLHQGIVIPSSGLTTTGLPTGTVAHDAWYELSGSESQLKDDYKAITGYTLEKVPSANLTTRDSNAGSGSYFGSGLDGEN